MLPHFHLTGRCRLWLFTAEQDDILPLLTRFIIPSITPRQSSIFTLQVSFSCCPSEDASSCRLRGGRQTPGSVASSHPQTAARQMFYCCRGEPPPPPEPPPHPSAMMVLLRREFMIGALSASLWQRSGDLAPISLISDRMGGEGSARGAVGGRLQDLFCSWNDADAEEKWVKGGQRVVALKTLVVGHFCGH